MHLVGYMGTNCSNVYHQVLTVDPSKSSLILTAKKSLVSSKLPIITSYNDCERDIECEGFIANISDKGVLVVFYGNVKVSAMYYGIVRQPYFKILM